MTCNCCHNPKVDWEGLKTEGTVSFSLQDINPLSIQTILQNWLKTAKLALTAFPEALASLILRFTTLDNFGNSWKVPEQIGNGRYTKINITKNSFIANILKPSLGECSFRDMLRGTIPFPENKLSYMSLVYKHDLPTLDLDEIKNFGDDFSGPSSAMEIIAVAGITDFNQLDETKKPAEYMVLNSDDDRPKDICITKAFDVLDSREKSINMQIICDFRNKNEKTITFVVNGKKIIPDTNKNKDYSLKIKKEDQDVKFVPFIYCQMFMKIHFPKWKYGNMFEESPSNPDNEESWEEDSWSRGEDSGGEDIEEVN